MWKRWSVIVHTTIVVVFESEFEYYFVQASNSTKKCISTLPYLLLSYTFYIEPLANKEFGEIFYFCDLNIIIYYFNVQLWKYNIWE